MAEGDQIPARHSDEAGPKPALHAGGLLGYGSQIDVPLAETVSVELELDQALAVLAFHEVASDRTKNRPEFVGSARREIHPQHTRIVVAEQKDLPGFVPHAQKSPQVVAEIR